MYDLVQGDNPVMQHHLVLHCCKMDWRAAQYVFRQKKLWASKLQDDINSWQMAPHDSMMQCCPSFPIL